MGLNNTRCLTILFFILIFTVSAKAQTSQKLYVIDFSFEDGDMALIDVNVMSGSFSEDSRTSTYRYEIMSFRGQLLYKGFINIPENYVRMYTPPLDYEKTGYVPPREKTSEFSLLAPYFPNAKEMHIYKSSTKVLTIPLESFATCNENDVCDPGELEQCSDCSQSSCGDGTCSGAENYLTCRSDCKPEIYCGNNECDAGENFLNCPTDCSSDVEKEKSSLIGRMVVIMIIFLVIAVIVFLIYSKVKGQPPTQGQYFQQNNAQQYGNDDEYI